MTRALRVVIVIAALISAWGCSKAPDTEESQARQALSAAAAVEAATYAPAEWRLAQDTMKAATTEKAAQDDRFVLMRSYGEAKRRFEKTTVLANQAKAAAAPGMERAQQETQVLLDEAGNMLDAVASRLLNTRMGKDDEADVEMIQQDIAGLKRQLDDAHADFQRNDFTGAAAKANAIMEKLTEF